MGMTPDQREFLYVLNAHKVKYLLIGGYAVGVHSQPRTTKDLDIFIRSDQENSEAVYRALADFGAPLAGYGPEDFYDGTTFQIGQPPSRIDILQKIDGVEFDDSWESRVQGVVEGTTVPVISAEKLVQNKLASGRTRDLADVEAILATAQAKRGRTDDLG